MAQMLAAVLRIVALWSLYLWLGAEVTLAGSRAPGTVLSTRGLDGERPAVTHHFFAGPGQRRLRQLP